MKFNLSLILVLLLSLFPTRAMAADDTVPASACVLALGYKTIDELKGDLELRAKRSAVDQLFGALIRSSTAVQQSVLTHDEISESSVGYVHIKGIPDYHNSPSPKDLATVCVSFDAYVTAEDRLKFKPVQIAANECVTNADLGSRKLQEYGEQQTIIKALVQKNAKLAGKDRESLLKLVQNVEFSKESRIMPNTDTYCGSVTAEVVPAEIDAFLASDAATASDVESSSEKTANNPYNDEFNGPTLNKNWTWLHENPSHWSLKTIPGKLQIIATGGDYAWQCNNFQNLLLQPAPSGDFELETRVFIRPTQNYQQAGLIIWSNADNWVELEASWHDGVMQLGNPSGENIEFFSEQNGDRVPKWPNWPLTYRKLTDDGVFLKISKQGNLYESSYSSDGKTWTRLGSLSFPSTTNLQIGIFAVGGATSTNDAPNCSYTVTDIPVNFDYFHLTLPNSTK